MSSLFLSLLLVLLLFSHSSDSRSVADVLDLSGADAVVDLNRTTFDDFLKKSPAGFAIVEFFAHWCPACRNYKPHYEKVARLFNGPHAVHPGLIVMTRVDCADKMNTDLCNRFSVSHYPMLLWGPPIKFAAGRWDPKKQNNEFQPIEDGRTAERLLNWINKRIGRQLI
ncbi:sulfhydryl oxidase 1-like [Iris pallida]|uniref:Sulfhydryl oxidase 1-like n=1 Tax=Iris pallida TaxID=29817 RepID=A0AAX6DVH3_IRIPA|nr:sulfhydryl oxidase 1-like [Iris pallida]